MINQMQVASALAEISIQTTRKCKEDYLYELISIINALENGEEYVLFTRGNGADGMDRFGDFENIYEGIEAGKKSLGVTCAFVFKIVDHKLFIEIINVSLDKSTIWALTNGLDSRWVNYVVSE